MDNCYRDNSFRASHWNLSPIDETRAMNSVSLNEPFWNTLCSKFSMIRMNAMNKTVCKTWYWLGKDGMQDTRLEKVHLRWYLPLRYS